MKIGSITRRLPICACGKRCHATKEDARRRYPDKRIYRCPFSDQYHVASKRGRGHFRGGVG